MFRDENVNLYAYVLLLSGVVLGAMAFAEPPRIEVTGVALNGASATEEIETATLPATLAPRDARAWNHPVIPWRSHRDGLKEMKETGKPGILVLQAEWCLECRAYQEQFRAPQVLARSQDFVFMLVDIDREPDLQKKYAVDGDYVPRTIALNPDGSVRLEKSGGHPRLAFFVEPGAPDELAALLKRAR